MVGYTDNELKALEKADEAFAEVRKVALEFAKQTGTHYRRNVTDWTSGSYFNTDYDAHDKCWNEVHDLYHGDNSEACECAWAIEDAWNTRIVALRDRYDGHLCGLAMAETDNEYEYYDRRTDEDLDARSELRDEVGRIVENWYDSASECAYSEYLEEVA